MHKTELMPPLLPEMWTLVPLRFALEKGPQLTAEATWDHQEILS